MIEPLREMDNINGKPILHMDDLREKFPEKFNESGAMDYKWFEKEIRPNYNIYIRHDVDSISFNMLTKPASEGGDLNRCQATELIKTALHLIQYYNGKFPCRENAITITKLEEAIMWQVKRTVDRQFRGVEGKNKK